MSFYNGMRMVLRSISPGVLGLRSINPLIREGISVHTRCPHPSFRLQLTCRKRVAILNKFYLPGICLRDVFYPERMCRQLNSVVCPTVDRGQYQIGLFRIQIPDQCSQVVRIHAFPKYLVTQ